MEHLVKKAQHENDAESFIQLMELNRQSMLKVARSYLTSEQDVADAMQDTILTCYEKLHTLQQPQYFKTWLIRIVITTGARISCGKTIEKSFRGSWRRRR